MAHYTEPPKENKFFKTREEQEEDFKFLSEIADKNCPACFGRAYQGWDTQEEKFIPCSCVLKNLEKLMAEQNTDEADQLKTRGILMKFRELFGIN